jgi:hypothetical protein
MMMTTEKWEKKWNWVEEAVKLGYTLEPEERARQHELARIQPQVPSPRWEINSHD